jgi:hypothetical protein
MAHIGTLKFFDKCSQSGFEMLKKKFNRKQKNLLREKLEQICIHRLIKICQSGGGWLTKLMFYVLLTTPKKHRININCQVVLATG